MKLPKIACFGIFQTEARAILGNSNVGAINCRKLPNEAILTTPVTTGVGKLPQLATCGNGLPSKLPCVKLPLPRFEKNLNRQFY